MAFRTSNSSFSLLQLVVLVATLSHLLVGSVDAHGFISNPGSRSYKCKQGQVRNCGEIQYEPQSVEAPKGLPFIRNNDGKLCSAGLTQFAELDRQGSGVWPTTKASDVHSFDWTFTAQHATTDFKYFITKANWDSSTSQGLTASDFDSAPFLTVPMNGRAPPATMNHDLSKAMPSRSGYHVVYAVWTVDNTANAFYQCIDLDFGGGNSKAEGSNSSSATPALSSGNTSAVSSSGSASTSVNNPSYGSGNDDSGSSGNTSTDSSSGSDDGSSDAPAPKTNTHATKGNACRMKKRRRAPSASLLAARGDYRQYKMQMHRERHA